MENREQYPESDPRHHTIKIRGMLNETIQHVREDVGKIEDPRGQETTAEVLSGLVTSYEHYENRSEEAWRD